MKSLIALSHELLVDCGEWCGVSTLRDSKTASDRIEHEGLSFLTITLPSFAKDFERSLELGKVSDDLFLGFAKTGGLPRFLGGFLRLVFRSGTGLLLDDPSVTAIRAVRQYCHAFAKIELPCSDERNNSAVQRYIECEQELSLIQEDLEDLVPDFSRVAWELFGDILSRVEHDLYDGILMPRHGPGATQDKLVGNSKYQQSQWPLRLEPYMPAGEYLLPNWRYWDDLQRVEFLEPGDEGPTKVTLVPKTLKTPRIIAIEPTCMQYAQQALMREFVDQIERHDSLGHLIGFRDQLPNQEMAREGSLTGKLATLDLSEASDRVSNRLVVALLARTPFLSGAVQGCRSTKASVLDKGEITLTKFASMGSALTFPIEAMVFLTIIALSWEEGSGRRFTRRDRASLRGLVRVYGDDLLVPVELAPRVSDKLAAYGLKVNQSKSFWNGSFRESCGGDFYAGEWVTPVRVRSVIPQTHAHADQVVSTVSLRNQLFELGLLHSVEYLDKILERVLPMYPALPLGHPGLGRWTYEPVMGTRMCADLQVPLVKALSLRAPLPASPLNGAPALMKYFLERGVEPLAEDAFMRAGRPRAVYTKLKWLPLHIGVDAA